MPTSALNRMAHGHHAMGDQAPGAEHGEHGAHGVTDARAYRRLCSVVRRSSPARGSSQLVLTVVVVLSIASCNSGRTGDQRGAQAQEIARQYLIELASDDTGRGWDLLHPTTRETVWSDDFDRYLATTADIGPEDLTWRLAEGTICDDDLCSVAIDFEAGPAAVPDWLVTTGIVKPIEFVDGSTPDPHGGANAQITILVPESGIGPTGVFVGPG